MLGKRNSLILALILSIQILTGCGGSDSNTNESNSNERKNTAAAPEPEREGVKDNSDELSALIKLPFQPEDVVWKEFVSDKPGGQQGKRLLAVFQLTAEDSKKLVDRAAKIKPGTPVSLPSEKWFPTELVTQSEIGGEQGIQAMSYPADEFFLPPYTEGTLSRVDNTDFFVLELFAK